MTNRAFAVAKIAGIEMCWAYNRQYGTRYFCAMSTNLYGLNDTYDLEGGHVLPAMMRRFHEAKLRGDKKVVMWGTGASGGVRSMRVRRRACGGPRARGSRRRRGAGRLRT